MISFHSSDRHLFLFTNCRPTNAPPLLPGLPPIGPRGRQFARHHQKIELLAFIINSDELYTYCRHRLKKKSKRSVMRRGEKKKSKKRREERGKGTETEKGGGRKGHRLPKRRRLHSSYIGDERIAENLFSGARCVVICALRTSIPLSSGFVFLSFFFVFFFREGFVSIDSSTFR